MAFLSRHGWLDALRLGTDEVPRLLVLEGTWWAADKAPARLRRLEGVRPLGLPGIHHGWYQGLPVAFCFVYGAARAVEPVHIFGEIGDTPRVVLIGSCGGIAPSVRTGDVVVPEQVVVEESTSAHYREAVEDRAADRSPPDRAAADPALVAEACAALRRRAIPCHAGTTVTTSALLTQHPAQVEGWARAGLLGVDLEASAVYSAAARFRMRAAALLFCWDELARGRSWLATFSPEEVARQSAGDEATYDSALEIGCRAGAASTPATVREGRSRPWN